MITDPPFLSATDLTKTYGSAPPVLERLNFSAREGDFISLIGPSGCGKSTLLKLFSGLSSVTAGSLQIGGLSPLAARDFTSFIFQEATLLPWRTVARNVELGLELKGVPLAVRRETARRLLETVGLSHAADFYPRQLSGGMKMRASVARALAIQPRLLLMDEPFGALDEFTRNYLNEELLKLRQEHRWTALFVTHSVAEAVFLSNRIFVMAANPGRISREIEVPFPYPRPPEIREQPEFLKIVGTVSTALRSLFDR